MDKIIIPKLCKAGFCFRKDTFQGKLAYVIYNDGKTWRKQDSWEGWREKYISPEDFEIKKKEAFIKAVKSTEESFAYYQTDNYYKNLGWAKDIVAAGLDTFKKKQCVDTYENFRFSLPGYCNDTNINPIEFKNEPREGFVLNKRVGGTNSGWNHRQTKCRIYDPLGFEFEISIENLLYILENTSSIKGKGIEGKMIYGWWGKDLVLIPENAPDYQEMIGYTNLQSMKIKKSELVEGKIYKLKDNSQATYMGYRMYYDEYLGGIATSKKLWIARGSNFETVNINKFGSLIGDNPNYAELFVKFNADLRIKDNTIEMVEATPENIVWDDRYNSAKAFVEHKSSYKAVNVHRQVITDRWHNTPIRTDYSIWDRNYRNKEYSSLSELLKNHKLWIPQQKTTL